MFICMGLASSAYDITPPVEAVPGLTKILTDDLTFTKESLGGNSGLIRIWFAFVTGADYELTVTKGGSATFPKPFKPNGDNNFVLKDIGYYRFDVGVKPGDLINLKSSVSISAVNDFLIQQIQIGA